MYNSRNEAREERMRQQQAAGVMGERFPGVESIVVTMNYKRERTSSILRTLHFNPGSTAFFKISCLGEGCDNGGLDLTPVIHRMIRGKDKSSKGELSCENSDPAVIHADVDYNVTITYA